MKKIPTVFVRQAGNHRHDITKDFKEECMWVRLGYGIATEKVDGINVKIDGEKLWKRSKPASGPYTEASYVLCNRGNPSEKWLFEAFDRLADHRDGIYECVGPKIFKNPYNLKYHELVPIDPVAPRLIVPGSIAIPRTYEAMRDFLTTWPIEGLVFRHPGGAMAKVRREDFGLKWPV